MMNERMQSRSSFIVHRSAFIISYWLPLLLWLAAIFYFSSDAMSAGRTSRFIEPMLRLLMPWAEYPTILGVHMGVRKAAHVAEYALLALLAFRAVRGGRDAPRWRPSWAAAAFAIAVAYAVVDEVHQGFVRTRSGSVFDVLTDAAGALGAVAFLSWWLGPRRSTAPYRRG
jgi:VanZ family protein